MDTFRAPALPDSSSEMKLEIFAEDYIESGIPLEHYEALEALERFLPVLFWAHVTAVHVLACCHRRDHLFKDKRARMCCAPGTG